jgi:hypothetical protein
MEMEDVRMLKPRGDADFVKEAIHANARCELWPKNLDSNPARKLQIFGKEY